MDSMTLDSLSNVISKKLNVSVDSITNDEIDSLFGYKWTFTTSGDTGGIKFVDDNGNYAYVYKFSTNDSVTITTDKPDSASNLEHFTCSLDLKNDLSFTPTKIYGAPFYDKMTIVGGANVEVVLEGAGASGITSDIDGAISVITDGMVAYASILNYSCEPKISIALVKNTSTGGSSN